MSWVASLPFLPFLLWGEFYAPVVAFVVAWYSNFANLLAGVNAEGKLVLWIVEALLWIYL